MTQGVVLARVMGHIDNDLSNAVSMVDIYCGWYAMDINMLRQFQSMYWRMKAVAERHLINNIEYTGE
jgi:hypothetical protein